MDDILKSKDKQFIPNDEILVNGKNVLIITKDSNDKEIDKQVKESKEVENEKEKKEVDDNSKSFFKKIKKVKNIEIIIAVIAVLVMLLIYFSSKMTSKASNSSDGATITKEDYCTKMENDLSVLLNSLDGAGQVKVVINWESSVESVIAYITNTTDTSSSSTPQVIVNSGLSQPIILKEIYPKALGVIIVSQGGDDVKVKMSITNAVTTLLGISANKVNVYKMN